MVFEWEKYKRAIENEFTIVNKDKLTVPFLLNKAQNDFIQKIVEKNVILKSRKLGFSSLILGIAGIKFLFGKNEKCVSMSFDASASAKQLERAKHFIKSFEIRNKTELKLKYNSKSELVYEGIDHQGEPYVNTLRIGTAKVDSFGRGDDITFLHLTEVAQADNLENLLAGVGEAVVNNAIVTLETTANGFSQFKSFWDEAEERGYRKFFYAPTWEYSKEYLEEKERNLKRLFDQEYPMTDEIAFLTSGEMFFDSEALRFYNDFVKNKEPITYQLAF